MEIKDGLAYLNQAEQEATGYISPVAVDEINPVELDINLENKRAVIDGLKEKRRQGVLTSTEAPSIHLRMSELVRHEDIIGNMQRQLEKHSASEQPD